MTPHASGDTRFKVAVLEGMTLQPAAGRYGADLAKTKSPLRILNGAVDAATGRPGAQIFLDEEYLEKHVLFLGAIGTGKTNAIETLLHQLRHHATGDDVFVVFDTKGDFRDGFGRPGDAVLSPEGTATAGGVVWNVFADLAVDGDEAARADQAFEITAAVFADALRNAGQNRFFAAAASDIFGAVLKTMGERGASYTNADLREVLEKSADDLLPYLDLGTARYLDGERRPEDILSFLQQTLTASLAGVFATAGGFSVRDFVRRRGGRALFIEYDIAIGSRLLPVYKVLIDMAIKEALSQGLRRRPGNVYFVMDEFALLPHLEHLADGINFGRSLGLKFVVGAQNVNQVHHAYGPQIGQSILAGFGTVFGFRLADDASRDLIRQRYGANRQLVSTYAAVRADGVDQTVVAGNVVEDWHLSQLGRGSCVVCLPYEQPPFRFTFQRFQPTPGPGPSQTPA